MIFPQNQIELMQNRHLLSLEIQKYVKKISTESARTDQVRKAIKYNHKFKNAIDERAVYFKFRSTD